MDGLFKKAADFASDYASGQNNNNQNQSQNQNQNQQYQQQQQGSGGGLGALAQSFLGGNSGNQQQQQQQQQQYPQQSNPGGMPGGFVGQGHQEQGQGQGQGYNGGGQQGGAAAEFFNKTGGSEYNAPHGSGGAGYQGGGGGGSGFGGFALPNLNQDAAISEAQKESGNQQDSSLFSSALGFLQNFSKDDNDVDEDKVVKQHEQVYDQGKAGQMDASSIGSAAALQAMKNFMSGGAPQQQQHQSSGGLQSKIIGMALSEAAKMFDKSGGAASGTKQDAVNSAGATIMKLLLKSQFSGAQTTGGSNSGGLGQLMGMASKFL